ATHHRGPQLAGVTTQSLSPLAPDPALTSPDPEIRVSIHVALNHVTHYTYDRLINLAPQVVRLRPAPHCRTRILSYSLKVEPAEHFVNWQQDPFSNHLARLVFPEKTKSFKITV